VTLPPGPYLERLRSLRISTLNDRQPLQRLPPALAAASSLQMLHLSGNPRLQLPPSDLQLLRSLPCLLRLALPLVETGEQEDEGQREAVEVLRGRLSLGVEVRRYKVSPPNPRSAATPPA
jgi:hypothetical protein